MCDLYSRGMHGLRQLIVSVGATLAVMLLCACELTGADQAVAPQDPAPMPPTSSSIRTENSTVPTQHTYSRSGFDVTPLSEARVAELATKLTPEAFRVTQGSGTEPAFCGNLVDNKLHGVYCCVVCGLPLFSSESKFNSGTGWPSFFTPVDAAHVSERVDRTHGMERTEINCARCRSHLGHVFSDGPRPTGLRFCLNSAALTFYEKGSPMPIVSQPIKTETAYFAGGCFWGVEHVFQEAPGVITATSGYMQGSVERPTYEQVCTGKTGHAEAVQVIFDPSVISFRQLLEGFFELHDPTQVNRQGPDSGTQYRSGVFCTDAAQLAQAQEFIAKLGASTRFSAPIATQVELAKTFYPAEDYHQDYVQNTGRVCHVGNPWPQVLGATK